MSRIGNMPVPVPDKVDVTIDGTRVRVKGPLGELERTFKDVTFEQGDGEIRVLPAGEEREHRAMWGLGRTLLDNMVVGVSKGFERSLVINGVGYRAEQKGDHVVFTLGYSHPIEFLVPEGLKIEVDKQVNVKVSGINKELVGQTAARIRSLRAPEPYKGKGVRYADEHIRRKAGKAAK
ncbi:MAG: 50S ribosomal protein L6 [Myxococcota bacterium]